VQLIDGESGRHIWAERYDRKLEDDSPSGRVDLRGGHPPRSRRGRDARLPRKTTDNMAAYECVLAAKVHHRSTRDDNVEAERLLDRAIAPIPAMAAHA
jgi:adenylate cyclase